MNPSFRPKWESMVQEWLSVFKSLQSRSASMHNQRGHSILRIIVVIDAEGNPVIWSKPSINKIEPVSRTGDFLEQMSKYLSE